MKKSKKRADDLLVLRQLARDLSEAKSAIMRGRVYAQDPKGRHRRIDKAGTPLDESIVLAVQPEGRRFVSRGGEKLDDALTRLGIDVEGLVCADIGVSTGGFTDCLLQRHALRVHAVDVGYGDIAWRLRNDPRVVLYERTNARALPPGAFQEAIGLMTIDVSFISLTRLFAALVPQLDDGGRIVALVKPQFELPPGLVPSGGVVVSAVDQSRAVDDVCAAAERAELVRVAEAESAILGKEGNREFFVVFRRRGDAA